MSTPKSTSSVAELFQDTTVVQLKEVKQNSCTVGETIDNLIVELQDLINPNFKAWYAKRFYALGKDEVLKRASLARADGFDKRKYFSVLIKK